MKPRFGGSGRAGLSYPVSALVVVAVVVLSVVSLQVYGNLASGGSGGSPPTVSLGTVCMLTVTMSGSYDSLLVTNTIVGFHVSAFEGNCSPAYPWLTCVASANLLPTSLQFSVNVSGPSSCHANVSVNVPELQTSYSFSQSASFWVPRGTYSVNVQSGIWGGSGSTSVTVT